VRKPAIRLRRCVTVKKNNGGVFVSVFLLVALLLLVIYLENFVTVHGMFFVVLKKGVIYSLLAVSLNLLNGFTGLFSLGQAGFMLIGAYTYSIFSIPAGDTRFVYTYYDRWINFSIPEVFYNMMGGPGMLFGMLIAIILAGLMAALVALLIGFPVLRLKSNYLAIATLGFGEIIRAIFMWDKLGGLTNGSNPLRRYARDDFFKIDISGITQFFNIEMKNTVISLGAFFYVFLAAMCIIILILLVNSSYGRAFKAIREDEIAAEAMGINLYKHKQLSFCISSFFTGVGGAMFAMFMTTVAADNFRALMTYELLLIVVLGGLGSITGSIISAMLFVAALEWGLRGLDSGSWMGITTTMFSNGFRLVVFSVFIMLVVLFFRRGIMGDKELPYLIKKLFGKQKVGESNG
jgi:branched-chain amino acid transport system permease protein